MKYAAIGPISIYLPETVETNDDLSRLFPKWDMDLIYSKTGIRARHIAAPGQCASDLGVAAAEKLFAEHDIDRAVDRFPAALHADARLPAAHDCLPDAGSPGPADVDRGARFQSGLLGLRLWPVAGRRVDSQRRRQRVLLITAETYSKYIAPEDRSLRTIFGDGAAATLIEAAASRRCRRFASAPTARAPTR